MCCENKINVNNEGGRLNDIVILRSISILLVVFVHSFYIYNYGSLSDIDTIVIKIERFFNLDILNKFRMPMFIFISGFLFSFLHYRNTKLLRITLLGISAFLLIFLVNILMDSSRFTWARLFSPASSILIVLFGYSVVNRILNKGWIKDISIFEKINKLSYGIYICHPWLIDSITSNKIIISIARDYTLLFPLFLFLFALGVSMFFSKLMLKTKIGRFLIG